MTTDDRIELLAALVQRKWRALTQCLALNVETQLVEQVREEWAAASLLLQLAQDNEVRLEESYFAATRAANAIYLFVRQDGDINAARDALMELATPKTY